jgi:uncharacterized membrane protein YbaN (DUF454 family)
MRYIHYSKKIAFLILGCVGFLLGLVGLMLPVVPQVPFFLLAFYGFVRGSDRLHRWLHQAPKLAWLRKIWETHQPTTPEKAKRLQLIVTIGVLGYAALGGLAYFLYRFWKNGQ